MRGAAWCRLYRWESKRVKFRISDILRTVSYRVTQRRLLLIFGARFRRVPIRLRWRRTLSRNREAIDSETAVYHTMRRKCACTGLMVSIEFGRSPLLGKLYRRTSGSAGPSKFRQSGKKKRDKRKSLFLVLLFVNSKFNSSQKRVQSCRRVRLVSAKSVLIYRKKKKKKNNSSRSVRGTWVRVNARREIRARRTSTV